MPDHPAGQPNPLGGLVRQLSERLAAAAPIAPATHFPQPDAGRPRPPAVIDPSVATGPAPTPPALAQADRILRAAGFRIAGGWTLRHQQQAVTVRDGEVAGIGRSAGPDVGIVVPDGIVSRVHCRISVRDGRAFVEDRGSSNGTLVRRMGSTYPVEGTMELESGDELTVLDRVTLAHVERDVG